MFYPSMTSASSRSASRVSSKIVLTLALTALCGCSSLLPKKPPAPAETKQPPAPVLPAPQPVKTEAVKWRVVEVGGEPAFALTEKGYEALSRNMAEVARWMKEASFQLQFYRASRQAPAVGSPTEAAK